MSVNGKPLVSKTRTGGSSPPTPECFMKKYLDKTVRFFKETRAETKKVVWPDRRHVTVATVIILFTVLITGIYVLFVDFVFTGVFGALLR